MMLFEIRYGITTFGGLFSRGKPVVNLMTLTLYFRIIFCFFLVLAVVNPLRAQTEEGKKLIALEKKRFDAMKRGDTTQLASLLADSLIFIHSSGVIDNKVSFLKDIGSGRITYLFILPEKVTVVVDGNYAWIFGRANVRFKLASMTGNIDQYVSFVEVYQLKRYQWKMILCHNARIEENAPYYNSAVPQVTGGHVPSIY
jgi:hypothetical protein